MIYNYLISRQKKSFLVRFLIKARFLNYKLFIVIYRKTWIERDKKVMTLTTVSPLYLKCEYRMYHNHVKV